MKIIITAIHAWLIAALLSKKNQKNQLVAGLRRAGDTSNIML